MRVSGCIFTNTHNCTHNKESVPTFANRGVNVVVTLQNPCLRAMPLHEMGKKATFLVLMDFVCQ
jgi:hypothetical protein